LKRTLIIAEAGVNHNGSMEMAKQLIDVAADAGADIVKFQSFKADKIVSKSAKKAQYQVANMGEGDDSQYAMLKKLELSEEQHETLIAYCAEKKIKFLSTAFDADSIQLLKTFGINIGKIPSGEITNLPYLRLMAATFPNIILSTGMCNMDEIAEAVNVLLQNGVSRNNITILHCTTEYPAPLSDVNLLAMKAIADKFSTAIGYSDHTEGIAVSVAAAALGATLIEKHFTLDKSLPGPDHKASLNPNELKDMVKAIREVDIALGTSNKQASAIEEKNKIAARKSIVAAENLAVGDIITQNSITTKRPGNGISPMRIDELIGKKMLQNKLADELMQWEDFC